MICKELKSGWNVVLSDMNDDHEVLAYCRKIGSKHCADWEHSAKWREQVHTFLRNCGTDVKLHEIPTLTQIAIYPSTSDPHHKPQGVPFNS